MNFDFDLRNYKHGVKCIPSSALALICMDIIGIVTLRQAGPNKLINTYQ